MGGGCKGKGKNKNESKKKKRESSSSSSMPEFSEDETMLMDRMYKLIGPRWSLIAGRIPGRSAEEIEKYFVAKYESSSSSQ